MSQTYDIGIIGSGPAGYTAAFHASAKGLSVVMFEKDKVGGVCLNKGCIPTKAILHSAEVYQELKSCETLGVYADNVRFNFAEIIEHKNKIVEKLRKNLELFLKNAKVNLVNAEAKILSANKIEADGIIYECSRIIAASGAEPRNFKGMEVDGKFILNSDDVLNLEKLPRNIVIVGSGAIGVEWARIFSAFGVEVTVVELAENLLPLADIEVSKRVERIFKTGKIKFYKGIGVDKIENPKVYLTNGEVIETESVLVAIGRKACEVSNVDGITFIGDACGAIQLAHFASKQAIEHVAGISFDKTLVPSVIYGNPEIAWVGKREQDLEAGTYKKASLLISALGKSHCDNATDGFIKILSQNDMIVGAHIVSKEASAMVQELLVAIQNKISVSKLKEICFAHPTYSEGIYECLFKL